MVDLQTLAVLGLNSYESAAYVALLGRPELSPAEVASRGNIPRQRVYDVLDSLAAKGLCAARDTTPKVYVAIDPRTAFDVLARDRVAALERQRNEAQAAAARLAAELAPVFASGRNQTDPLAYVEVLSGPARIAQRALALAEAAKKCVNSCINRPMILSKDQDQACLKAPLGRGLTYRALLDAEAMEDADLRGWMTPFRGSGLDIRITPALPMKMRSFDDEVVLVSMQDPAGGEPSFTAVAIHNRGVVAMLNLAFEHLWDNARPFRGEPERGRCRGRPLKIQE
jgi:HTH-type transcriptional regulator, sugar sensing transcriptional regulator